MAFNDLPKVRFTKQPEALRFMTKETAKRKFIEKCNLKRELRKQLAKCEKDLTKYFLTMRKNG